MGEQRVRVGEREFVLHLEGAASGTVDGKPFAMDVRKVGDGIYHVLRDGKSYEVEMLPEGTVSVNGAVYRTEAIGRFDALLKQLGMDRGSSSRVAEVRAPMPGLVLKISVETGAAVSKGDPLLVLEAMKMENVIKSPADGTVATIEVTQGSAVEKGQVMVRFA